MVLAPVLYSQAMTEAYNDNFVAYSTLVSQIPIINNNVLPYKYKKKIITMQRRGMMGGSRMKEIMNYEGNDLLFQLTELVTDGRISNPVPYFELAIEKVLDVNKKDRNGETVLQKLTKDYRRIINIELIDLLIKNDADVNYIDSTGETMLHKLARNRLETNIETNIELVKYLKLIDLVSKGVDVNSRNSDGETALLTAVINKKKIIAGNLKKNGAEITIGNNRGRSPLSLAGDRNDYDWVVLLLGNSIPEDITTLPYNVQKTIQNERARNARKQEWATYLYNNPYSLYHLVPPFLQFGKKVKRSKHNKKSYQRFIYDRVEKYKRKSSRKTQRKKKLYQE